MFIPGIIIVVLIVLYFYNQNKLRDEISNLRGDIQDLNHQDNSYYDYDDLARTPKFAHQSCIIIN